MNGKLDIEKIEMGIYRHFKGGLYELFDIAEHTETGENLAIYRSLDKSYSNNHVVWARPINMFFEYAPQDKENKTRQKHRFEYVSSSYKFKGVTE